MRRAIKASRSRPIYLTHFRRDHSGASSPSRAPLIPKLRGYFAEFLNEGSLDHLLRFRSAYQCRFAVRALIDHSDEAFLGSVGSAEFAITEVISFPRLSTYIRDGFAYPGVVRSWGRAMSNGHAPPTFLRPPFALKRSTSGTGILTCCPSPTTFVLGLGPTNPTRINLP